MTVWFNPIGFDIWYNFVPERSGIKLLTYNPVYPVKKYFFMEDCFQSFLPLLVVIWLLVEMKEGQVICQRIFVSKISIPMTSLPASILYLFCNFLCPFSNSLVSLNLNLPRTFFIIVQRQLSKMVPVACIILHKGAWLCVFWQFFTFFWKLEPINLKFWINLCNAR